MPFIRIHNVHSYDDFNTHSTKTTTIKLYHRIKSGQFDTSELFKNQQTQKIWDNSSPQ